MRKACAHPVSYLASFPASYMHLPRTKSPVFFYFLSFLVSTVGVFLPLFRYKMKQAIRSFLKSEGVGSWGVGRGLTI